MNQRERDERLRDIDDGDLNFAMSDGHLILTVAPEHLVVCSDCPHLHVMVLESASAANLRMLAAAIAHLAEHVK
jgi:hypothetical protein